MCAPATPNEAQKFLIFDILDDFSGNIPKFQIFLEQPIFIIKITLMYEKTFIFAQEQAFINIKSIT